VNAHAIDLECVIGLEVHVQLRTDQKLFCADSTRFGDQPNTNVCPVCLGLPGALPVLNGEAVDLAVLASLAFGCVVHETSIFARKNYFYPDLPKGYQISQFERPLATGGCSTVETDGVSREVRIRRIHLEEDAGKSLHDRVAGSTAVDLNRAGTPLIELVSEPDIRSAAEARSYLQQVKQVLEYLDVSDCNMEEGSLRVDANISIRPRGVDELGTKTELKNMNSFSNVEKALDVEIRRQVGLAERGQPVEHVTLLWDEAKGDVRPMRSKEESHDYRYFPDPDLSPVVVPMDRVEAIRAQLPELPVARRLRFEGEFGLPAYDANVLTSTRALADYYEAVAAQTEDPKQASNWIMGPVLALAKERGVSPGDLPLAPEELAGLIGLVQRRRISQNAGKDVLRMMVYRGVSAQQVVLDEGLTQIHDVKHLDAWVEEVLAASPEEVERFQAGEHRLQGYFMGKIMKASRGKADPGEVSRLLLQKLEVRSPR
jgi:aspartyl-tRNA(Asn)/glutamyl-tRNA(Gln) amidotransferase subunit B